MTYSIRFLGAVLLVGVVACQDKAAIARADSLQALAAEQQALSDQLASQKDSLTRVVLDADAFLGQMDSAIRSVRGLPRTKRSQSESPLADQVANRKEMMERVNALVTRAQLTGSQLTDLQQKYTQAQEQNEELRAQLAARAAKIEGDVQLIADLGATIERQKVQIVALESRIDSLNTEMRTLGTRHYRAYYVIGTEKELMEKGVAVKEGGANLLIARPGRTLVPARVLDPAAFVAFDQRAMREIHVPDSTRRYRVISRHSLDATDVEARDGTAFRGDLKITKPDEFWAASRFLIVVKL